MTADTKKNISEQFGLLRKFNYSIWNGNTPGTKYKQEKGLVDHIIINNVYLIYVEVKIGKDDLTDQQRMLKSQLQFLATYNKSIFYFEIKTFEEAKDLVTKIIEHKLL